MFKNISFGKKKNSFPLQIQDSSNINTQPALELSLVRYEREFCSLLSSNNLSDYKGELEHLKKCSQIGKFNKRIYRNAIYELHKKYAQTTKNVDIAMETVYRHLDICERLDNLE